MLTGDLAIMRFEDGAVTPDRLTRGRHGHYMPLADAMLRIYRNGKGHTRKDLHTRVATLLEDVADCEMRRVHAFCKLLDDVASFERDRDGGAARLRLEVFRRAAPMLPLTSETGLMVGTNRAVATAALAQQLGRPWEEIERALYADVLDNQPLLEFRGHPDGAALLSAYNVAQVQACLYRAVSMRVDIGMDFKQLLRGVKLNGLMHTLERKGARYVVELDGPASVLRTTTRYGVNLAGVVPWLLSCKDWKATARVRTPWDNLANLELSSQHGLQGTLEDAGGFDSRVEEGLARKFDGGRDGWTAHREAVVLHVGQLTFIPDFAFRHEDGTEVLLEIVGYWTPEYLEEKRRRLTRFRSHRILLALPEKSLKKGATAQQLKDYGVIAYKTAVPAAAVVEALERVRAEKRAPRP